MRRDGTVKFEVMHIIGYDDVEIRFNKSDATFSAEFLGEHYTSTNLNEVKNRIRVVVESRKNVVDKPVIIIDFDRVCSYHLSGFSLDYGFLETINYPNGSTKQRLVLARCDSFDDDEFTVANWRKMGNSWDWTGDYEGRRLIDYTEAKYLALKDLSKKFDELRDRVLELLRGGGADAFIGSLIKNKPLLLSGLE
ncbi:MAG: hypothetical protein WC307_06315 [Candidatus Nanoarchaeia archaeon]|jgi:hypothetical protein